MDATIWQIQWQISFLNVPEGTYIYLIYAPAWDGSNQK
jgi:hypothetical protein